jgi:uncharacterized membrane protein YqjE
MDGDKSSGQKLKEAPPVTTWLSTFLDYFSLKTRLLAAESREAAGHFIGLLTLLVAMLVPGLCNVLLYGAFFLYLVALLFHLAWGWSALICGVILTVFSVFACLLLRTRLRKSVFQMSLKDLEKDKEWLTQSKTQTP